MILVLLIVLLLSGRAQEAPAQAEEDCFVENEVFPSWLQQKCGDCSNKPLEEFAKKNKELTEAIGKLDDVAKVLLNAYNENQITGIERHRRFREILDHNRKYPLFLKLQAERVEQYKSQWRRLKCCNCRGSNDAYIADIDKALTNKNVVGPYNKFFNNELIRDPIRDAIVGLTLGSLIMVAGLFLVIFGSVKGSFFDKPVIVFVVVGAIVASALRVVFQSLVLCQDKFDSLITFLNVSTVIGVFCEVVFVVVFSAFAFIWVSAMLHEKGKMHLIKPVGIVGGLFVGSCLVSAVVCAFLRYSQVPMYYDPSLLIVSSVLVLLSACLVSVAWITYAHARKIHNEAPHVHLLQDTNQRRLRVALAMAVALSVVFLVTCARCILTYGKVFSSVSLDVAESITLKAQEFVALLCFIAYCASGVGLSLRKEANKRVSVSSNDFNDHSSESEIMLRYADD